MSATIRSIRAVISILCLLAVAFTLVGNAQATATPAVSDVQQTFDGATVSLHNTTANQVTAMNTWTSAARQSAKPLQWKQVAAPAAQPTTSMQALGTPGTAPGGMPAPGSEDAARRQFASDYVKAMSGPTLTGVGTQGTSGVFDSYPVNLYNTRMWTDYPYKAIGKLYFLVPGGLATCTASVISPNNIIVTAAHCVYDNAAKSWYGTWIFVPGDRAGAAPYGTFAWTQVTIPTAYINGAPNATSWPYDVAVIKLANNGAGKPVTYYTGWLGRAWNFGYTAHLNAFGYPGNLMSGYYSWVCSAETYYAGITDLLALGCDQMYGSSGGPWIWKYTPYYWGANNYVMGTVSGGIGGSTWGNTFYGPRFSSNNIVLICNTIGC